MDILGISFGIDTSAALIRDGRTVAAALEERFSRIKHDRAWPSAAIDYCLREAGTSLMDVDSIAFFWNPAIQLDFPQGGRARTYRHHGDYLHMAPAWLLGALRGPLGGIRSGHTTQTIHLEGREPLVIHYVTHHRTHAAAAFFPSPFEEAAVLTVDGYGERAATTLGAFRRDGDAYSYESVEELVFPQSLGSVYAAVTTWLGFRANNGEGKVMGLAPYGDERFVQRFREILGIDSSGDGLPYSIDQSWFAYTLDTADRVGARFLEEFGPPAQRDIPHNEAHKAVAFAMQSVTEEALLGLARRLHARTGLDSLVMAGGVAMNSAANGRLEREGPFADLWVQPSAGDGGTAAGAALHVWHMLEGEGARHEWPNDRFGPSFSAEECRDALRRGGWSWDEPDDIAADTAAALADGELVGWFQGRAEFGMRALGSRSILADPRSAENKDVLNARVKFREPFRPFAPSVAVEAAGEFFDLPQRRTSDHCVPSMQKVHPVKADARERLAAVTHVDGSARLQTVSTESDALYHQLITEFGRITGVPVVLNTSFNVRGEPIVGTPDDAIRCWASTGLDRLVLGPCVLRKPLK
ncbi:MAG: carbamoyltransferase [Deltaproteobacteria bacterium]|nr:carbamoyltransferase [Deltaproteobacteria bacterium]